MQLNNVPAEVAKKLPGYPLVPTTLIGRLAVSIDFRGQGHCETLLMDALHRILQHSRAVASVGVIVDAKDADAVSLYKKYGFLELPDVGRRLFLPMGTIVALFRYFEGRAGQTLEIEARLQRLELQSPYFECVGHPSEAGSSSDPKLAEEGRHTVKDAAPGDAESEMDSGV